MKVLKMNNLSSSRINIDIPDDDDDDEDTLIEKRRKQREALLQVMISSLVLTVTEIF